MSQASVLIVEDDAALREALSDTLKLAGYRVLEAQNGRVALDIIDSENVEIVVSDVQMDVMDGHNLLRNVKAQYPDLPVVLMTAYGTIPKAVEAMHDGAVDYLVKPFEAEVLVNMVGRYLASVDESEGELVCDDPRTMEVVSLAHRVAESDATVLITGESGTGKEVFAREIHRSSKRAKGPFIAINCAAIPENMLEAMLFGYEKGSFTGAYKSSPGKFEQANGGTLLLDEISEMDLGLQAKLLRVLQEREVERLGGTKLIPLDVRVLGTTNREMRSEVAAGRFREDLYYRLNVFPLHLPPLRERPRDIVPMVQHLLRRHLRGTGKPVPDIAEAALQKLVSHSWPGNVRELDNVTQRALILHTQNIIRVENIMFEVSAPRAASVDVRQPQAMLAAVVASDAVNIENADSDTLNGSLKSREYKLILDALKIAHGSRKSAADKLGISQRTLRYKLAQLREHGFAVPAAYSADV